MFYHDFDYRVEREILHILWHQQSILLEGLKRRKIRNCGFVLKWVNIALICTLTRVITLIKDLHSDVNEEDIVNTLISL